MRGFIYWPFGIRTIFVNTMIAIEYFSTFVISTFKPTHIHKAIHSSLENLILMSIPILAFVAVLIFFLTKFGY